MLTLNFRKGEECYISFPGQPVVKVIFLENNPRSGQCKLGFDAPRSVSIDRKGVYEGKKRDGTL